MKMLTWNRWQVARAEIEAALISHPEIVDAAVIGVLQDDGVSEVPWAFVVRHQTVSSSGCVTTDEVYGFARKHLASYKALDGGIVFVEEIPRTASGKIQRFKLAKMNSKSKENASRECKERDCYINRRPCRQGILTRYLSWCSIRCMHQIITRTGKERTVRPII